MGAFSQEGQTMNDVTIATSPFAFGPLGGLYRWVLRRHWGGGQQQFSVYTQSDSGKFGNGWYYDKFDDALGSWLQKVTCLVLDGWVFEPMLPSGENTVFSPS
jgi:hypothetical protein